LAAGFALPWLRAAPLLEIGSGLIGSADGESCRVSSALRGENQWRIQI